MLYLQKPHILRLTFDYMSKEHVRLIWNQIIFIFDAFHTK